MGKGEKKREGGNKKNILFYTVELNESESSVINPIDSPKSGWIKFIYFIRRPAVVIFLVILFDQLLKFWVKTHMYRNEAIRVFGDYFQLHFIENSGMAFGMEFGGDYRKLILSVFRIVVVIALAWYLNKLVKQKAHPGLLVAGALICAGALGNIIDSAFYGMIFTTSNEIHVAALDPANGYAGFLHGNVVDMLYFPLFEGHFPKWFPFWGGEEYQFFRPVFNVADSSISVGVFLILLFQKRFFKKKEADSSISDSLK